MIDGKIVMASIQNDHKEYRTYCTTHWSSPYLYAVSISAAFKKNGLTNCGLAAFYTFLLHKAMCLALWHLSSWVSECRASVRAVWGWKAACYGQHLPVAF